MEPLSHPHQPLALLRSNRLDPMRRLMLAVTLMVGGLGLIENAYAEGPLTAQPGQRWMGPDGDYLPFENEEEVIAFLRTARVVSFKPVGSGVTNPVKVLLEKDGVKAHAIFRDICVEKEKVRFSNGTVFNFRDDALFEVAAYELARLLGLDNVPPAVRRSMPTLAKTETGHCSKGSLQLWIEGAITEKKRIEKNRMPESPLIWAHQNQMMLVFDNLIYNDDRNQGNVLMGSNSKLWMIDHTRAFRCHKKLPDPGKVKRCERRLWERLRRLDQELLHKAVGDYLEPSQIKAIIRRRDLLVRHILSMIEARSERAVLFDLPSGDTAAVETLALSIGPEF